MKATYQSCGFFAQADLLFLDDLGFIEVRHDILNKRLFFRIRLASARRFQKFLDTGFAGIDDASAFLDDSILSLDLLQQVCDLGR